MARRLTSISTLPTSIYNAPQYTTNNNTLVYKIITLGTVGVGKSTMISTYIRGEYQEGVESQRHAEKILIRGDKLVQLHIWDTAGQERYDSITPSYYRDAHGCLLCFDVTDEQSVTDLFVWLDRLHDKSKNVCENVLLVGTKSDRRDTSRTAKSLADCKILAKNIGLKYKEVTVKKQETINSVFEELLDMIIKHDAPTSSFEDTIKIGDNCNIGEVEANRCC